MKIVYCPPIPVGPLRVTGKKCVCVLQMTKRNGVELEQKPSMDRKRAKGALGLHKETKSPGKGGRVRIAAPEGINSASHDWI